jgi:hypothetical protein
MHYQLSFLDDAGLFERCAHPTLKPMALLWMQVVGAERALHPGWSLMELLCCRRCVARASAHPLRRAWIQLVLL